MHEVVSVFGYCTNIPWSRRGFFTLNSLPSTSRCKAALSVSLIGGVSQNTSPSFTSAGTDMSLSRHQTEELTFSWSAVTIVSLVEERTGITDV